MRPNQAHSIPRKGLVQNMGLGLGTMTIRIAGDTSAWDRAVSGVHKSLDTFTAPARGVERLGGHFTRAAGGVLRLAKDVGLAAIGLEAVGQTAMGVGKALVGSNASMEQTRVAFTQLLGSSKAAGDYLKKLQAFAAATPFEFPELTKDAEQMMGMGFSAKAVIPMLTDVGDAIAAMGGGAMRCLGRLLFRS